MDRDYPLSNLNPFAEPSVRQLCSIHISHIVEVSIIYNFNRQNYRYHSLTSSFQDGII